MGGLSPPTQAERPILIALVAQADSKLRELAGKSNETYIFGLFGCVAAVFQLRGEFWGRKVILFVDNEVACAALTRVTAENREAPKLVCAL